MKQSINESQFIQEFIQSSHKYNFTYDGLAMLYEYLETIDENYELDIVAIACEYTESSAESIAKDYGIDIDDADDEFNTVLEYLNNNTFVVGYNDDIIVYANF